MESREWRGRDGRSAARTARDGEHAPHLHFATADVDGMFNRVVAAGMTPLDHQQPGVRLGAPVTRPWGDREFELEDPDGHRIIFTQA